MKIGATSITIGKIVNHPGSSFNGALQEKYNVIVPGWLARNQDGTLYLFVVQSNMDVMIPKGRR